VLTLLAAIDLRSIIDQVPDSTQNLSRVAYLPRKPTVMTVATTAEKRRFGSESGAALHDRPQ
jgi:hypothetical protein